MNDYLINAWLLSMANLFMIYGIGATAHTGNKWWLICFLISICFYVIYAKEQSNEREQHGN